LLFEAGGLLAQQGVLWVAGVGEDGVAVLVEVAE